MHFLDDYQREFYRFRESLTIDLGNMRRAFRSGNVGLPKIHSRKLEKCLYSYSALLTKHRSDHLNYTFAELIKDLSLTTYRSEVDKLKNT